MRGKRAISVALAATLVWGGLVSLRTNRVEAADAAYTGEYWYDQIDVVQVNREPARAAVIPYETTEQALQNEASVFTKNLTASHWVQSLNGMWDFYFAESPAERLSDPDELELPGGHWSADFDKIQVPCSVEAQRNDDNTFRYASPIYTNQNYPWGNYESVDYSAAAGTTAKAPTLVNGVSHFQRSFTLPANWQSGGRQVYLDFEGVESAFYLYINGKRVGYAEDSYTTDEFNITPYLKAPGEENTVSVQVYRWSTGSYLENQDFIRLSGIFRNVNLYSRAALEIRDLFLKPEWDADGKPQLTAEVDVRNHSDAPQQAQVQVQIYPQTENSALWAQPLRLSYELPAQKPEGSERISDLGVRQTGSISVENPKLWTADAPNLYRVVVTLLDANGSVQETLCQRVGFRKLESVVFNEANQHKLLINDKKIYFRGTNRHESDLQKGRALGREAITRDLMLMKQNNINGIRTSHYPNDPITYDLADELGIYICDEANIESHNGATQAAQIPSGHAIWNPSVMDRTQNMVERDKNHPCVVIWSLGNEATYRTYPENENYCFWNSSQWILQRDPSRIRKYERDNRYTANGAQIVREQSMVDLYSTQYWGVGNVESQVTNQNEKLPYIQSEYSHAMGNAIGNLKEYWDVFRKYENAHGGFIWDWIDQSLLTTKRTEREVHFLVKDQKLPVEGKFVPGKTGNALQGAIQLDSTYQANSTAGMTLDAWVQLPARSSLQGDLPILSKGDNGYNLKVKNGKFEVFFNGWMQGVLNPDVPLDFTDGNWHRLTGVVDETGAFFLYYDGKLLSQRGATATAPFDSNRFAVGVGVDPEFTQRHWPGSIDSIRILKRAMTADEIAQGMAELEDKSLVYGTDFTDAEIVYTGDEQVTTFWGYGGDWDDQRLNDGNFVGNGILSADREPTAKLNEVRKVHQEVNFYDTGKLEQGEIKLVNEFPAQDLQNYEIQWELLRNTEVIGKGDCSTSLAPQEETLLHLELPALGMVREGDDYFLQFHVRTRSASLWAPAGYEIASEQFTLHPEATESRAQPSTGAKLQPVEEQADVFTIAGQDFSLEINRQTGAIQNYLYKGENLLIQGPVVNYFRAPTDNDPKNVPQGIANTADNLQLEPIQFDAKDGVVQVRIQGKLATATPSPLSVQYSIFPNGEVVVQHQVQLKAEPVYRVGMRMTADNALNQVTYYGRGPWENYVDRNTGSFVSLYETTVEQMESENKYLRPQEFGNRTDVRYVVMQKPSGVGLMVSSENPFSMEASHILAEDMVGKRHAFQVPRSDSIFLQIDTAHRGLGNASCGPGPLGKYTLTQGEYKQSFRIQPISSGSTKPEWMEMSKTASPALNAVADIKVGGVSIGFDPQKTSYTVPVVKNTYTGEVPTFEVVPAQKEAKIQFDAPKQLPATVQVDATSIYGVSEHYEVQLEPVDSLYLSDMPWTKNESGYFANSRDRSDSNPISLYVDGAVQKYDKGVGTHAPSRIAVDLTNRNLTTFTAQVGINSNQAPGAPSDVIFRVLVDGEIAFEQRVLAGESFPCKVDVRGAKTVVFEADTNGPDYNDHATWADAQFTADNPPPVDKTALEQAVREAESLKPEDYTAESWEAYAQALQQAKETLAKEPVTQSEIDQARKALEEAKKKLEENPETPKSVTLYSGDKVDESSASLHIQALPKDWEAESLEFRVTQAPGTVDKDAKVERILLDAQLLRNGEPVSVNNLDMVLTFPKNFCTHFTQEVEEASIRAFYQPAEDNRAYLPWIDAEKAQGRYAIRIQHLSLYGMEATFKNSGSNPGGIETTPTATTTPDSKPNTSSISDAKPQPGGYVQPLIPGSGKGNPHDVEAKEGTHKDPHATREQYPPETKGPAVAQTGESPTLPVAGVALILFGAVGIIGYILIKRRSR